MPPSFSFVSLDSETWGGGRGDGEEKIGFGGGRAYLLHELLDLGSERVLALRGNGKVEFLLGGVFHVIVEIGEVGGGLEVDFPVVGVHCSLAGERG